MPNPRPRQATVRCGVLAAAMAGALALSVPVAFSESAPDPQARDGWGASAGEVPTVTKKALRGEDAQGYFRVSLDPSASDRPDQVTLVYWMPRGSASAAAPPEVQRTRLFRAVVAADVNRDRNLTILGPNAYAFSPELGADSESPSGTALGGTGCPNGAFCIFADNNYGGGGFYMSGVTPWRPLSNWGWNDRVSSAINKREKDSKLSEHVDSNNPPNPGGSIHCYDGNSWHPDFNDGFNDEASGIRNSDFFTQC